MTPDQTLRVGGYTPLSSLDYPGELAAVVFCQGCPWRCGYCQNLHLLGPRGASEVPWGQVLRFLEGRVGLLDAVVFSGGEPTLQRGLPNALRRVRALGFKTGLHTAGPYPGRLAAVLPLLDWVGMDVKAPFADYPAVTGVPDSGRRARSSARLLAESGVEHEFRTTVHPDLLDEEQVGAIERSLLGLGARNWVLQECVVERCLEPRLRHPLRADWLGGRAGA